MEDKYFDELVKLRLERAEELVKEAKKLLKIIPLSRQITEHTMLWKRQLLLC